jgi:methylmalonyl-CoA/ethylmalonyl-CoA epimerase
VQNPLSLNGFIQIAIVVQDIDKAIDRWCDLLNAPRPTVRITQAEPNPNEHYRGEVASYGLKLAVIENLERGFIIELHEVDDSPSTFREFINKHGNGVHHIGFQVGDALNSTINELQSAGYTIRNAGVYPNGSWTVIEGEDTLGVNLNIKPHM